MTDGLTFSGRQWTGSSHTATAVCPKGSAGDAWEFDDPDTFGPGSATTRDSLS
jgi:hypothetical protein